MKKANKAKSQWWHSDPTETETEKDVCACNAMGARTNGGTLGSGRYCKLNYIWMLCLVQFILDWIFVVVVGRDANFAWKTLKGEDLLRRAKKVRGKCSFLWKSVLFFILLSIFFLRNKRSTKVLFHQYLKKKHFLIEISILSFSNKQHCYLILSISLLFFLSLSLSLAPKYERKRQPQNEKLKRIEINKWKKKCIFLLVGGLFLSLAYMHMQILIKINT